MSISKGGRNLIIMGVAAAIVALCTTSVSLAVYHSSGDIYLDRSRPGFLPDEDEIKDDEKENDEDYEFDSNTTITKELLDEYLQELSEEIENLETYDNPFSENGLSDERLGI